MLEENSLDSLAMFWIKIAASHGERMMVIQEDY